MRSFQVLEIVRESALQVRLWLVWEAFLPSIPKQLFIEDGAGRNLGFIKVNLVIYFTLIAIFRINNSLYHPFVSLTRDTREYLIVFFNFSVPSVSLW